MEQIVEQRRAFDCGVATLAYWCRVRYEDAYVAAVLLVGKKIKEGLTMHQMLRLACRLGRPVKPIHYRRVDLEEDAGILGVNWNPPATKGTGHWVILVRGVLIDPMKPSVWDDAEEYLKVENGRVGTLLADR